MKPKTNESDRVCTQIHRKKNLGKIMKFTVNILRANKAKMCTWNLYIEHVIDLKLICHYNQNDWDIFSI